MRRAQAKHLNGKPKIGFLICTATTAAAIVACVCLLLHRSGDRYALDGQMAELRGIKNTAVVSETFSPAAATAAAADGSSDGAAQTAASILPEYRALYEMNPDLIGWLTIDGTQIDYPVMQTPDDEEYYLHLGFDREPNSNGCLIMDTDSAAGVGTAADGYVDGAAPSTNLIIHGHTMKSGAMFGGLQSYADASYGAAHSVIRFDSLYEHRTYELIAAFYSQVYYTYEDVFKFYNFFQADTQAEFDDWIENITALSLYDTGVTASFGDEFITLSCCSYQTEDGRFVVVGKRVA